VRDTKAVLLMLEPARAYKCSILFLGETKEVLQISIFASHQKFHGCLPILTKLILQPFPQNPKEAPSCSPWTWVEYYIRRL
jgi:hypothetical protein